MLFCQVCLLSVCLLPLRKGTSGIPWTPREWEEHLATILFHSFSGAYWHTDLFLYADCSWKHWFQSASPEPPASTLGDELDKPVGIHKQVSVGLRVWFDQFWGNFDVQWRLGVTAWNSLSHYQTITCLWPPLISGIILLALHKEAHRGHQTPSHFHWVSLSTDLSDYSCLFSLGNPGLLQRVNTTHELTHYKSAWGAIVPSGFLCYT